MRNWVSTVVVALVVTLWLLPGVFHAGGEPEEITRITIFIICSVVIAFVVDTLLLLLLGRLIGRAQFSLSSAIWCTFIRYIFFSIVGFFAGLLFAYDIGIGLLITIALGCAFQTLLFKVAIGAASRTFQWWRSAILSGAVILGDFVVVSPLIAFLEYLQRMPPSLFIIAMGLALLYAILKPLSDGLFDTSAWVAKILAPTDIEDDETTMQFLKFGQAALMEGWLSNIPLISSIVFFSSIIIGFIYHWWIGIIMYFISITLGELTKILWGRSVSYYLFLLYHKMVNRTADYKTKNDVDRSEAAESYCRDLEQIIVLYQDSRLRPPTPKQLKDIPFGDLYYWLERGA